MKKYLQISVVFVIFGILVLIRNMQGDNNPPVVGKSNSSVPTSTPDNSSSSASSSPNSTQTSGTYRDGTYTGSVEDVYYGNFQVQAVISGGRISDIQFLQYPNDNPTSVSVNTQANPILKQEAIAAQSSQVDIVSGASDSSMGFQRSLANALSQAK